MHDTLLLFGATGDLAARQLFPSLAWLLRDRLLPPTFRIVAVARHDYDGAGFRAYLGDRLGNEIGAFEPGSSELTELLDRIDYVAVDLRDIGAIAEALKPWAGKHCVSYLSTPPDLFASIAKGLKAAGVLDKPSRLVLEKPIGSDLESAREINATLRECLSEDRVFRIDHYLGKAAVQNLIALRFGNTLLEAVWQHRWIESVDILVAETAGVDGREGYYANYGALRDMIQNHVLQLLCLIAMEPPASLDADAVRDEKVKVLRALRPLTAALVNEQTVRGRYEAGVVGGRAAKGFVCPDDGRPPVETFVAVDARIDNWRWTGVPFRLATGKRLAERATEVIVTFKPTSHWVFEKPSRERAKPNRLLIRLQPQENIELELMGSLAGPEWGAMELQPLSLDLSMTRTSRRRIAYERLLLDALNGNPVLFVRNDEVEAAWTWIDSIVDAWKSADTPIESYLAGSWGPSRAARFVAEAMSRGQGSP